jgi:protein translocase SecG subunit
MLNFSFWAIFVLFIFLSLFLILLVLIQKGRGGGLSSAFSGGGGNTAFGSKTGDVLTWTTAAVFGVFMLLAVALNLVANAKQDRLNQSAANAASVPVVPVSR